MGEDNYQSKLNHEDITLKEFLIQLIIVILFVCVAVIILALFNSTAMYILERCLVTAIIGFLYFVAFRMIIKAF